MEELMGESYFEKTAKIANLNRVYSYNNSNNNNIH